MNTQKFEIESVNALGDIAVCGIEASSKEEARNLFKQECPSCDIVAIRMALR
jgi:hypothetical protein